VSKDSCPKLWWEISLEILLSPQLRTKEILLSLWILQESPFSLSCDNEFHPKKFYKREKMERDNHGFPLTPRFRASQSPKQKVKEKFGRDARRCPRGIHGELLHFPWICRQIPTRLVD